MNNNTLELDIIAPENSQSPELKLNSIKTWLSEIQLVDPKENVNLLISKLQTLNNSIIAPDERFEILQLFTSVLKSCYEALRKHFTNLVQPLSQQKINLIKLSIKMYKEILLGYKIIIYDINAANNHSLEKKLLPNTIYKAFTHCNDILNIYYQSYTEFEKTSGRKCI